MDQVSLDMLRNAAKVAEFASLSEAASAMNKTKGALSQQIKLLEAHLGFPLFERHAKGMRVTQHGHDVLTIARQSIKQIEDTINQIQRESTCSLTIGTTTYFASRWLSPRLMRFMQRHPDIRLRIQPMVEPYDIAQSGADVAIRWGQGRWNESRAQRLFLCPSWPTGNAAAQAQVDSLGIGSAFANFVLLSDGQEGNTWVDWFSAAHLPSNRRTETLVIPDPNVRVQAVIDGQGVALNDDLISQEMRAGLLFRLHSKALENFGYWIAHPRYASLRPEAEVFIEWILSESRDYAC